MRAFQDYIIKKWRESDDVTDAHATLYEYEWGPRKSCSGRYLTFNLIERGTNETCRGIALWKSGELESVSFLSDPPWVEGLGCRLYEVLNKWTKDYKDFQDYIIEKWLNLDDPINQREFLTDFEWDNTWFDGICLIFKLKNREIGGCLCKGWADWSGDGVLENVNFLIEPSWIEPFELEQKLFLTLEKWTKDYK